MPLGQPYTSATCRSPAKGSSRSSSPANGRSSSPSGSALREHVPFEKFGDLTTMFEGENGMHDGEDEGMHTLKELIAAVDDELETLRRLEEEQEDSSATAAAQPTESELSAQKLEELLAAYRYSHDDVHEHAYQAEMLGRRPHGGGALGSQPWPPRGRRGHSTHGHGPPSSISPPCSSSVPGVCLRGWRVAASRA